MHVSGAIKPTFEQPTDADIARLWLDPVDITTRDLFYGSGGEVLMLKAG